MPSISIDPTAPESRALAAAFLGEHPEHRPYLLPEHVRLVEHQGDLVPLAPLLPELRQAAESFNDAKREHNAAMARWSEHHALRETVPAARRRTAITGIKNLVSKGEHVSPADLERLERLEVEEAQANRPAPRAPEAPELVAAVAAHLAKSDDQLTAQLVKYRNGEGQPIVQDACAAPGCCAPLLLARGYGGAPGQPRWGTSQWHSVPPWDGLGFCGQRHSAEFGKARLEAFNAFGRWLLGGAQRLADEVVELRWIAADDRQRIADLEQQVAELSESVNLAELARTALVTDILQEAAQ